MSPALTVPAMISGEIDYFDDRLAKEVAKELGYRVQ
jgi:hypothetical protein